MNVRGLLITTLMSATLLAGCEGALLPWSGGASEPVQPVTPITAAVPQAPAMMNVAQPNELIGSWQMVQLPPTFMQPTRPTAPFSNPWQWFIISPMDATGVGRIGLVTRADPPQVPINDQILAEAWAQAPMYDTYRMAGGVMSITPVAVTGWSAQGTQTWRLYTVTNAGMMLGMQALPGDLLMALTTPDNKPLFYRMLRRIPRVQP
ncbi:MAG: hypothetical protein IPK59_18700 [Rhodospirillaceae bacterium]|nr:hypothetical protein [Rhodospirillaceae bacterium]